MKSLNFFSQRNAYLLAWSIAVASIAASSAARADDKPIDPSKLPKNAALVFWQAFALLFSRFL